MSESENFQTLKTFVFQAAEEGNLSRIQVCLQAFTEVEMKRLVSQVVEKTTLLIVASRNGHLNVVNYFLEKCKADVEQVGSVTFDGETIEGAPALWCAAAAGHFATVQSLMQHGARVNQTTFSNSTPLRAACFDGHFDIVQHLVENGADIELANRHGHTCLMISCYKGHYEIAEYLLSLQADVNRKSIRGNTALHDCAESGSLDIMKLLLKHHAVMDDDAYGMTPIKAAAVAGHNNIVDYLVTHPNVPKVEKVESLELSGATAVDKKRDMHQALRYWQRALDERNCDPASVIKKAPHKANPAYECTGEVDSSKDLENMVGDPDEMRMQALLIRERILGPTHPDTTYYIRYRGAVYADCGNFERCITLWMYALDMQQQALEPLNPMTQSSLLSFAELFAYMLSERNGERVCSDLQYRTVSDIYLKGISEIKRGMGEASVGPMSEKDTTNFNRALLITMHLMCLIAKLDGTEEEDDKVRQATYQFLKLKPLGQKGATPLHLAVDESTSSVGRYPVCRFPDRQVLHLLLGCGANVNTFDAHGNRPLHVAAKVSADGPVKHDRRDILRLLLDHGAHLDCRNEDGKTALDLLGDALCDISPLNYTSLQCLTARAVIRHGLKYIGVVPKRLEEFVQIH